MVQKQEVSKTMHDAGRRFAWWKIWALNSKQRCVEGLNLKEGETSILALLGRTWRFQQINCDNETRHGHCSSIQADLNLSLEYFSEFFGNIPASHIIIIIIITSIYVPSRYSPRARRQARVEIT